MSTSQDNVNDPTGSNIRAMRNVAESASPDRTIEDAAEEVNPYKADQGASLGAAVDAQLAMSDSQAEEEEQLPSDQKHSVGKMPAGPSSRVAPEILELQQRLLHLETRTMSQLQNSKYRKSRHGKEDEPVHDDKTLRKLIRKAPYGRKWVAKAEKQAEETAEDRKLFGNDPNKTFEFWGGENTIFHVAKDGEMRKGDTRSMWFDHDDWMREYGHNFYPYQDEDARRLDEPDPPRGVRPRSSLRPIYKQSEASGQGRGPLLPEWDTSDTDEWSTDTSTKSRDFDYYRARLRGDFEWELDRLNARVQRYRTRQEKKQSRRLADREKAEDERMKKEFEQGGPQQYFMQRADMKQAKPIGKYGMPSMNLVDWYTFRATRNIHSGLALSFAIDVLVEEPMISDTPWAVAVNTKGHSSSVDRKTTTHWSSDPSATGPAESTQDSNRSEDSEWNGKGPLPERIRINSKPIIDNLSRIHGKELCDPKQSRTSVVMLRPFRMLNIYANAIRESAAKAVGASSPDQSTSVSDTVRESAGSFEESATGYQGTVGTTDAQNSPTSHTQEPKMDRAEREEIRDHMDCLRTFVDNYISKKIQYLNSISCERIVFSDIWYLFTPGTLVISSNGKQAYRVASLRSKRHKGTDRWAAYRDPEAKKDKDADRNDITIKCVFVHFDGRNLGPVVHTFGINKFDGEKDVTSLEIFPLRFHVLKDINERALKSTGDNVQAASGEEDVENEMRKLKERLIERGKLFVSAAAVKHMYYRGYTVDTRDEIESQVMIDFEEAYSGESRGAWRPGVHRLIGTVLDPDSDEARRGCEAPCCWQENVHDDSYVETDRNLAFMDSMMVETRDTPYRMPSVMIFPRTLDEVRTGVNTLTDDELIIMSYSAPGYVLRDRSWAKLDLDNLFEVERSSEQETDTTDDDVDEDSQGALGQLVLPKGHKKMVLSLISQHFRNKQSSENKDEQVDIVKGKGKGLIILLHGAPGVGKTTTAEGVAETFKKPLFQITCGDLGSNPKEVESALQMHFALANKWGCILLLDEADVFLAERRREDFNRNGMVAVFLRVLEYYAGILFITTNRIGDFDEAFASRIHMSLYYPPLDEVSTVKVFRLNLNIIKNRLKERIRIEEDEIIAAACHHWREQTHARWNGRQIRNACQTALALAEFEAQPKGQKYNIKEKSSTKIFLKLEHLNVVSKAYLGFTEYLKEVHGTDAEGRAKESGLRALDRLIQAALKQDKGQNKDGAGRSPNRDDRSGMNKSPLHGFKLGSGSHSLEQPGASRPSSSSPEVLQHDYHPGYYGHPPHAFQPPRDAHFAQGHGMQYMQGAHASSQYLGGPQHGAIPAHLQVSQPGSHLQPPHAYPGSGGQVQGHYAVPQAQGHVHRPQATPPQPGPQGTGYTSAADSTGSMGPLTPISPPYHGGGSQAGQSQQMSGGWTALEQTGERGPEQSF